MENTIIYTGKANFTSVILRHSVTATYADMKTKKFSDFALTIYTGEVKNARALIEKEVRKVHKTAEVTAVKTEKVLASMSFEDFMKNATLGDVPKSRQ